MTSTSPKTSKALAGGIYRSDSVHEQVVADRTCLVRVLLYLCTLVALAVTMVFAMPQAVWADEVQEPEAGTGATTHQELVADGDTRDTYRESLGDDNSTRYAGRVWTDKTVGTEDMRFDGEREESIEIGDSDFLVAYSALATSQQITQLPKVPVDVVFVLDFSGSMNWAQDAQEVTTDDNTQAQQESRLQAMVNAINNSISALVDDNENNRIGIVVFNGAASTLLELTPASEIGLEGNYLEITQFEIYKSDSKREANATVKCTINNQSASTAGGTNIQAGLEEGMSLLSDVQTTTFDYEGEEFTRIPNVVLMSDGAPTSFSPTDDTRWRSEGSGDYQEGTLIRDSDNDRYDVDSRYPTQSGEWWNNLVTDQIIGRGDTSNPHSADGFMALLMASYKKNEITNHYAANANGAPNEEDAVCHVYTIGFSTDQQTEEMQEMVDVVLNPAEKLDQSSSSAVEEIRRIKQAWDAYRSNQRVTVYGELGNNAGSYAYEVAIPENDPNNPTSLVYPDQYFSAENADDLNNAFQQITDAITESAQAPTEVTGNPLRDGYITYTDHIGKYMHVDSIKALIYGGENWGAPSGPGSDDGTGRYTFSGTISSPVYGTVDASLIEVTLSSESDGTQTLTVRIPAAAIPLRVNEVDVQVDGTTVERNDPNNAYPLRLVYGVSIDEGVLNDDGTVNTEKVSEEYLEGNTNRIDGSVNFYTNAYDGINADLRAAYGTATVEFEPSDTNPFYFIQENTPLYTSENTDSPATSFDSNNTYYFQIKYYEGKGPNAVKTVWVARSGALLRGYVGATGPNGQFEIQQGAPRLGNLEDFTAEKTQTSNLTETAPYRYYPTFENSDDPHDGSFVVYLGNNGRLTVDGPATLTISKDVVSAAEGLAIPADVAETAFRFELTVEDFAGQTVPAVIRTEGESTDDADGDGQPDAASPTEETIWLHFDEAGNATVVSDEAATDPGVPIELRADQSLIVSQMAGKAYSVQEVTEASEGEGGYTPPVDFELQSAEIVAPGESGDADADETLETVASTVGTVDMTVAFVNAYNPNIALSADAALSVAKNLKGADLSGAEGDPNNFEFTITPTASTDGNTTAEEAASKIGLVVAEGQPVGSLVFRNDAATMTDGVATDVMNPFANGLRFDAHDVDKTFTYVVDEVQPANPTDGYEYDGDTHTVAYTVGIDPATGQLAVAMTVDGQSVTASEEGGVPVPTVEFNNAYHETTLDSNAVFNAPVTKELVGRDDVPLKADEFEFEMTVSANEGSSLNGVSPIEATAKNGADGTVDFGNITFKNEGTYTVEIQEVVPESSEPFVTYDRHKYSYTVTVTYDEGTNTLTATPSNPQVAAYNPETGEYDATVSIDANDKDAVHGAATFVNTYAAEQEKTVSQVPDGADVAVDMNGQLVGVGDELTYTINWKNTAVDEATGKAVAASVVVRDSVPAGTEYIGDSWTSDIAIAEDRFTFKNGVLEWNLGEQPAGAFGTITFKVHITDASIEAAIEAGKLDASNIIVANNQATVVIDGDDNPTTEVTNYIPTKQVSGAEADGTVQVGDVLTYTVSYWNTDPNVPNSVHIEDTLSKGLEYIGMVEGVQPTGPVPGENGETVLTWDIPSVAPAEGGTISYKVRVTEDAVTVDDLTNTATITVGKDSSVTNTPVVKAMSGDLSISKTVQRADGEGLSDENAAQQFNFVVRLTDAYGDDLAGTYQATGLADGVTELSFAADEAAGKEAGTATFTLAHGQTVTIHGLPEGAKYTVEEVDVPAGYAATTAKPATGTVSAAIDDGGATVPVLVNFTNVYNTETFDPASIPGGIVKHVSGNGSPEQMDRAGYVFELTVANVTEGAASNVGFELPAEAPVHATSAEDGTVSFGNIVFTDTGTYEVTVREVVPHEGNAGYNPLMTYDNHSLVYRVVVSKSPDSGSLVATIDLDMVSENEGVFTNVYYNPGDAKDVLAANDDGTAGASIDGQTVQVGDVLTYTVDWANTAVDENGAPVASTVVVRDVIPVGTELVEGTVSGPGVLQDDGRTIVWDLGTQERGASGTVSFQVRVTEDAAVQGSVDNTAYIAIGSDDPSVEGEPTNTTHNPVESGSLSISKTVVDIPEAGIVADPAQQFDFTVALSLNDAPLTGDGYTYTIDGIDGATEPQPLDLNDAGETVIKLAAGQTATIAGLPIGAAYEVTEAPVAGYTQTSPVDVAGAPTCGSGTVAGDGSLVAFTNTYNPDPAVLTGEQALTVEKIFTGRDWADDDVFTFTLTPGTYDGPVEGTAVPMPADAADGTSTVSIGKPESGTMNEASFDGITFTAIGTYTYTIAENVPEGVTEENRTLNGVTYDLHTTTVTVVVTDNDKTDGKLEVSVPSYANEGVEGAPTDVAAFTNTYTPGTITTGTEALEDVQITKRVTGSGAVSEFDFVLTLTSDNVAHVVAGLDEEGKAYAATTGLAGQQGDRTVVFGPLTFDAAGDYVFEVKETTPTPTGSWTYDNVDGKTITVHVTDDGKGRLSATVEDNNPVFTNSYDADPAILGGEGEASFSGHKTLNGRTMQEGEFTFLLTGADDATRAAIVNGVVELSSTMATNDAAGDFGFGAITFHAVGTYAFNIAEMLPKTVDETGTFNGVTYDQTVHTVKVTVTDNGEGRLVATADQANPVIEFTNEFTAQGQSSQVVPAVTKELHGNAMKDGQFSFTVVDNSAGEQVSTGLVKVGEDGVSNVTMSPIVYTADSMDGAAQNPDGSLTKTFTYTVSEVDDKKAGVTYDDARYTMTVVVTVNPDGTFAEPQVSYDLGGRVVPAAAFVNTYAAEKPAVYTPLGTKTTYKQDATDLGSMRFGFEVLDASGDRVSEGWAPANGDIVFGQFELPRANGTYTYTIRELNTDVEGLTLDANTYTLEVTVEDDGAGSYQVTNAVYIDNATGQTVGRADFYNTYDGGVVSLNLNATKVLETPNGDRTLQPGEFGFTVYDAAGNPVAYGINDAAGNVTFSSLHYSYNVVTTVPSVDDGPMTDEEPEQSGDQPSEQSPTDGSDATGEESGETAGDGAVTPGSDGATPEQGAGAEGADGEAGDAGEPAPAPDPAPEAGMGTDADGLPVDGQPETPETADPTVPDADVVEPPVVEQPAASDETAQTESEAVPEAQGGFSGEAVDPLSAVANALVPETAIADDAAVEPYAYGAVSETAVVSETGEADPVVPTDSVTTVESTDLGVHVYYVRENIGTSAGVTYDDTYYMVEVTVADDVANGAITAGVTKVVRCEPQADGTVVQAPVYDAATAAPGEDPCANIVFRNTYQVTEPAEVVLEGTKALTGRSMADGEFGFVVLDANGDQVASGLSTAAAAGEASVIDFSTIEIANAGTYAYTVRELNAGKTVDGVTYSTQEFRAVVTATDNGAGGLDVTVEYPDGPIAFTNTYGYTSSVLIDLGATKTLIGRDMVAGEFGFEIYDAEGTLIGGGTNEAAPDGEAAAIDLGKIAIVEPGTYDYTVREVSGAAGGVTYDDTVFGVTVDVVDNGDGTMSYTIAYSVDGASCDGIAFENTYGTVDGAKVEVTPEATKTLTGRAMAEGEFVFTATDAATGNVVATGANTADGKVAWGAPITLTAKGDYEFVIAEVNGRQNGVTYDDATYRLLVTVADDGEGGLTVESLDYPDGTPTFANSYTEPEKPEDPGKPSIPGGPTEAVPQTGDDTNLAGAAALGLGGLGAALLGGGALLRRRASR